MKKNLKFYKYILIITSYVFLISCSKSRVTSINVNFDSDIVDVNPLETTAFDWNLLYNQVYDSLFYIDRFGKVKTKLVNTWNIDSRTLKVTLTLKDNIYFSNSKKLTSNIIKKCFEKYIQDDKNELSFFWKNINNISIINSHKFTISLKKNIPDLLYYLSSPYSKVYLFDQNEKKLLSYLGTGEFKISEINSQKITLKRNLHSKNKKLEKITFIKSSSVLKDLKNGKLDYAEVSRSDIDSMNREEHLSSLSTPMLGNFMIGFNLKSKVWSNPKLRKIFNYIIDKSKLVENVKVPPLYIPQTIIPYGLPGYKESNNEVEIEKAKSLLSTLSKELLPTKKDMVIHLPKNAHSMALFAIAQINKDLRKINWPELTINFVKNDYGLGRIGNYYKFLRDNNFNMYIRGMIVTIPSPLYILSESMYSKGKMNFGKFKNKEVDSLLNEFSSSPELQLIQLKKINEILIKEMPVVMLGNLFFNPTYNISKLSNVGAISPSYIKFNEVVK